MKVAFLVQAHNQPAHLARLIRALSCEQFSFFVHIDGKTDITEFRNLAARLQNVHFMEQRERVFYGGLSQVRATLHLLAAASKAGIGFGRYCLLSGADFPIKSKAHIIRCFEESTQQLMRVDRKLEGEARNPHFENIERYFINDTALLNWRTGSQFKRYFAFQAILPQRKFIEGITPYHGSGWWCLTKGCVDYILEFLNSNFNYARFFRYAKSSDEIFFHSIVKASPFAKQISHDFERGTAVGNDHGSHYIDWTPRGAALPKVLDEGDLGSLMESGALFARKFDENKSRKLLEVLEDSLK